MKFLPHIITAGSITVIVDGESVTISRETALYARVFRAIRDQDWKLVAGLVDRANGLSDASKGAFKVIHGLVHVDGEPMPDSISARVLDFQAKGLPFQVLLDFWANLKRNPSARAKRALFGFLEMAGHPLTEDGCFLAYKKIRSNWKDCHTGTIFNRIGDVVEMDRALVDDDPTRTCSTGLHVASRGYASNFSSGRLIYVKVNPADVVAIPIDYNNEKMRVCRYEVMREDVGMMNTPLVTANGECFESNIVQPTEDDFQEFIDELEYLRAFEEAVTASAEPRKRAKEWRDEAMSLAKANAIRDYAARRPSKSRKAIAKKFGVGRGCVGHVLRGTTWV